MMASAVCGTTRPEQNKSQRQNGGQCSCITILHTCVHNWFWRPTTAWCHRLNRGQQCLSCRTGRHR